MQLSDIEQRFVVHWGEMGSRWGISRTVAQVHALLYIQGEPLHAEQITDALGVARSGVSTALKELQSWGLVSVTHHLGDRRDHFTTESDPWELFRIILSERKKREYDPTITALQQWYQELAGWPPSSLKRFVKLATRLRKLLRL
jgi:DNA-binding transcriptional regulator GbsR (MarR family)